MLAGMLLGNWQGVVALLGSLALLAGFLLSAIAFAVGTLLATGPAERRTTMGGVASVRNAGPAPAAIGFAFNDQPAILGALAAILLSGLAAALPIATLLSSGEVLLRLRRQAPARIPGNDEPLPGTCPREHPPSCVRDAGADRPAQGTRRHRRHRAGSRMAPSR
ncbi:hypothetical protein [Streptomyces sp. NBC_00893]|uniref:hypothetical protein n=1 Tax=Streptomyces sp. NBC_00893 TaxID=2975862 RepID=UPI00225B5487|nr:hypothetical protein [Streptomyces sp. NBC_00893]MCX4849299.1 hypothetical protein [Streptomyces sp. NBC_00893]